MEHPSVPGLLLKQCDLSKCEGRCCYDGVYVTAEDSANIARALQMDPDHFAGVPSPYLVHGEWGGLVAGSKTAVTAFTYCAVDYPRHFNQTKCVFSDRDHRCLLQTCAVKHGLDKWVFKPRSCWLFPLRQVHDTVALPPGPGEPDPHDLGPSYPGYSKYVPCGSHQNDGAPPERVLAEEFSRI